MKLSELEGKKILLIGMGSEGKATYDFLKKHLAQATIETTDEKDGTGYLDKQADFELAIKSPGVPPRLVAIPYTTSTNIFFANFKGFTIGITGTKGKSTTTKLLYEILKAAGKKAALAGNIGIPLLQVLDEFNDEDGIAVCELSSYQLEGFQYTPDIAAITNIFSAHLPHHGGRENYVAAKFNITAHAKPTSTLVYNSDFPELKEFAAKTRAKTVAIEPAPLAQPPQLPGAFNAANIRMAQTIAHLLEVSDENIAAAIEKYEPLPHRLQLIGEFHSIKFYDDATSTTPESTIAALEALENVQTLLLGGQDTGYDWKDLVETIRNKGVKNLVLFPDAGLKIKEIIEASGSKLNILETTSMEEAIKFAYEHTQSGGICLLSTAAPAFTVWKDYLEKADLFKKFVISFGKA